MMKLLKTKSCLTGSPNPKSLSLHIKEKLPKAFNLFVREPKHAAIIPLGHHYNFFQFPTFVEYLLGLNYQDGFFREVLARLTRNCQSAYTWNFRLVFGSAYADMKAEPQRKSKKDPFNIINSAIISVALSDRFLILKDMNRK